MPGVLGGGAARWHGGWTGEVGRHRRKARPCSGEDAVCCCLQRLACAARSPPAHRRLLHRPSHTLPACRRARRRPAGAPLPGGGPLKGAARGRGAALAPGHRSRRGGAAGLWGPCCASCSLASLPFWPCIPQPRQSCALRTRSTQPPIPCAHRRPCPTALPCRPLPTRAPTPPLPPPASATLTWRRCRRVWLAACCSWLMTMRPARRERSRHSSRAQARRTSAWRRAVTAAPLRDAAPRPCLYALPCNAFMCVVIRVK